MHYSLVLLLLIPLAGAAVAAALPNGRAARFWALTVSLATLLVGLYMAAQFDWHRSAVSLDDSMQLRFTPAEGSMLAVPSVGFRLSLGADSISLWLVLLTVVLTPLAILSSFDSIREREKEYYAWMLLLLTAMLGVFVARDLLLFYVFFELTLIPMFFIIGIWGGPERRYAAGKFFLFTFAGSVFTLAAVVYLGIGAGTNGSESRPNFDLNAVISYAQTSFHAKGLQHTRWLLALGLMAGFAVKVPLFPVHTWLPLAHTEAPTAGSVILAGVLLKLGTYGFLRLALPIGFVTGGAPAFPGLIHFIGVLCVIGIIYGALVAWVQKDIKKLVAYSSVSHLGFCILGLMAFNNYGIQGSVLYMINHGLSTGALFLCIGMIYDRYHTRDINELSGLAKRMPVLAFFFILFTMSSIGLPGLNGFVSEFLTILGAYTSPSLGRGYGSFAALGIILGAVYMLHMAARVIWGPLKTPAPHGDAGHGDAQHAGAGHGHTAHGAAHGQADAGQGAGDAHEPGDLNAREITILVPLAIAVVLLGVMPTPFLRSILRPTELAQQPISTKVVPAARVAAVADAGAAAR